MRSAAGSIKRLDRAHSIEILGQLERLVGAGATPYCSAFRGIGVDALVDEADLLARTPIDVVARVAGDVFARHVRPPSVYFQQEDDAFIIFFIGVSLEEAEEIAEICRAGIIEGLRPAARGDAVAVSHRLERVDRGFLDTAMDRFSPRSEPPPPERPSPDGAPLLDVLPNIEMAFWSQPPRAQNMLDIGFRPVWRPSRRIVGHYVTLIVRQDGRGGARAGYSALSNPHDPANVAAADLAMLKASANMLDSGESLGAKYALMTPIHFPTMALRARKSTYLDVLSRIPQGLHNRLVLLVVGLETRLMTEKVIMDLSHLIRLGPHVFLHLPLDVRRTPSLEGLGFRGVGTSLFGVRRSKADIARRLAAFDRAVRRFDAVRYVTGVETTDAAEAAIESGYGLVSGPVIGGLERTPNAFYPLSELEVGLNI